jgi:transcriptional regulator with XRE-family HTH domain
VDLEAEQQLAKAVGAAIGRQRAAIGLTQEAVAEALRIGPAAISRMERGAVVPSLSRLVEFAELFGCSVDAFLGRVTSAPVDGARSIAAMLGELDRKDREYVLELVERSHAHLMKKSEKN